MVVEIGVGRVEMRLQRVAGGSDMMIEEEGRRGGRGRAREPTGRGGNGPSSVVINGLNWISVERLIGDCRPPEDGVEQNCEQNYPGVERLARAEEEGKEDIMCAEEPRKGFPEGRCIVELS